MGVSNVQNREPPHTDSLSNTSSSNQSPISFKGNLRGETAKIHFNNENKPKSWSQLLRQGISDLYHRPGDFGVNFNPLRTATMSLGLSFKGGLLGILGSKNTNSVQKGKNIQTAFDAIPQPVFVQDTYRSSPATLTVGTVKEALPKLRAFAIILTNNGDSKRDAVNLQAAVGKLERMLSKSNDDDQITGDAKDHWDIIKGNIYVIEQKMGLRQPALTQGTNEHIMI